MAVIAAHNVYDLTQEDWSFALRFVYAFLGSWHEAEDVVQSGMLVAFKKHGQLREKHLFERWLLRILHNAAVDYIRLQVRQREKLNELAHLQLEAPDVEAAMDINRCVEMLGSTDRELIWLYYWEGRNCNEIAEQLGYPVGSVRRMMVEARQDLGRLVEDQKGPPPRRRRFRPRPRWGKVTMRRGNLEILRDILALGRCGANEAIYKANLNPPQFTRYRALLLQGGFLREVPGKGRFKMCEPTPRGVELRRRIDAALELLHGTIPDEKSTVRRN